MGFRRIFGFEQLDVTGAVDEELENVGRAHRGSGKWTRGFSIASAERAFILEYRGRFVGGSFAGDVLFVGLAVRSAEIEGGVFEFGGIEGRCII